MHNPTPILLTAYRLHVGGAERDLAKLARYLNPDLFSVHVACFHADGERRAEIEAAGIPILVLPVRSFHNRTAIHGAFQLQRYVRRHHIQLIQAFDAPTSIFTVPLGRLFGVRAVISNHLCFRFLIPPPNYYGLRLVDFLAHRIVVNAEAIKQHLIEDYGLSSERIFVCHNGVESSVFFPSSQPRPPLLADASVVIGTLCVFREEKRVDVLLQAFARLLPLDPRIRLLIVGDGEMREKWMARRNELGLRQTCHFEITTANVPQWMRLMDVFVLSSRSEGFPNAVLEAMACGCATVASNVGGVPELIMHGETGLLFRPDDLEDLAYQLSTLIKEPSLRHRLGKAAANRARTQFSMEKTARRMEALYSTLLNKT
ncbi:MAG: glycosyltransferase family 4 protein [Acidobacteriales bacterium]|nr:glycosyltransferase family 4 protein [Terriglobales bacterium]